jgi:hypothetical protein
MHQKIYTILTLLAVLVLSACSGHEALKAPCSPIDAFEGSPCVFMPVNLAAF